MKVLQRYFAKEIIRAVIFVLIVFLALFAFFDLISELKKISSTYRWQHASLFILLKLPEYAYELTPIAVLIGSIYALARFAAQSEFTVMRASSLSTAQAYWILIKIGILFALITFLLGEVIAPKTIKKAERLKLANFGSIQSKGSFLTGTWSKDQIYGGKNNKEVIGIRFINIGFMPSKNEVAFVRIYDLDNDMHLKSFTRAKKANYKSGKTWVMHDVKQMLFVDSNNKKIPETIPQGVRINHIKNLNLETNITPNLLSVLLVKPDSMSAYDLLLYKKHLETNNQVTTKYEIAFWKKVIYPFTIFVMMALALPFAYLHFRSGGISLKIFSGIMIGVVFVLFNNLFSHVGLLNLWNPIMTALLPSAIFLVFSIFALWWVERR